MVMGHDESNPTLITGGSDGRLVEWSVADGSTKLIQGELKEHTVEKKGGGGIELSLTEKYFVKSTSCYSFSKTVAFTKFLSKKCSNVREFK